MPDHIVSTEIPVAGVRTDSDVKAALQALYDAFVEIGIGQATFEATDHGTSLFVKHLESVAPDLDAVDAALRNAGPYSIARTA